MSVVGRAPFVISCHDVGESFREVRPSAEQIAAMANDVATETLSELIHRSVKGIRLELVGCSATKTLFVDSERQLDRLIDAESRGLDGEQRRLMLRVLIKDVLQEGLRYLDDCAR